jgi:hypothetical protein
MNGMNGSDSGTARAAGPEESPKERWEFSRCTIRHVKKAKLGK